MCSGGGARSALLYISVLIGVIGGFYLAIGTYNLVSVLGLTGYIDGIYLAFIIMALVVVVIAFIGAGARSDCALLTLAIASFLAGAVVLAAFGFYVWLCIKEFNDSHYNPILQRAYTMKIVRMLLSLISLKLLAICLLAEGGLALRSRSDPPRHTRSYNEHSGHNVTSDVVYASAPAPLSLRPPSKVQPTNIFAAAPPNYELSHMYPKLH